jgi:transcription antitermination factor NusG
VLEQRGAETNCGEGSEAGGQQPNWYVLFVRSNQEKRIATRLGYAGVEHFLPCYRSERQWKDRRVTLEAPLFPGYLFVKLTLRERMKVLTVPNVVSLVGNGNMPSLIPDDEIAWIRCATEHGNAMPHPLVKAGERIVITQGALAGLEGILLRMQNKTRVLVSIESIARAFVVDIDLDSIRALPVGGTREPPFPRPLPRGNVN